MSENTQNQNPKQEQYSLNDDRRVKVLSPGALVAKRFFRNRLAVVGLSILVAMFLFSFVGGLVSPYGQDEQFFTYTQMSKEFVGVTRNDTMRFVVADGQNFGSIAQSKALEAVKKGNTEFNYKDVDYTVDIRSDDFYVVYQGRDIMGYASRDLVNEADGAPKFSFDVKLAALTAMTAGEKEFAADGVDYTLTRTATSSQAVRSWATSAALSSPPPIPASSSPVTSRTASRRPSTTTPPSSITPTPRAARPSMTSSTTPLPRSGASSR